MATPGTARRYNGQHQKSFHHVHEENSDEDDPFKDVVPHPIEPTSETQDTEANCIPDNSKKDHRTKKTDVQFTHTFGAGDSVPTTDDESDSKGNTSRAESTGLNATGWFEDDELTNNTDADAAESEPSAELDPTKSSRGEYVCRGLTAAAIVSVSELSRIQVAQEYRATSKEFKRLEARLAALTKRAEELAGIYRQKLHIDLINGEIQFSEIPIGTPTSHTSSKTTGLVPTVIPTPWERANIYDSERGNKEIHGGSIILHSHLESTSADQHTIPSPYDCGSEEGYAARERSCAQPSPPPNRSQSLPQRSISTDCDVPYRLRASNNLPVARVPFTPIPFAPSNDEPSPLRQRVGSSGMITPSHRAARVIRYNIVSPMTTGIATGIAPPPTSQIPLVVQRGKPMYAAVPILRSTSNQEPSCPLQEFSTPCSFSNDLPQIDRRSFPTKIFVQSQQKPFAERSSQLRTSQFSRSHSSYIDASDPAFQLLRTGENPQNTGHDSDIHIYRSHRW